MSDDSDWEDASKHNALLEDIRKMDRKPSERTERRKVKTPKKTSHKVEMSDLLGVIKSTRNIGGLKKKLEGYEMQETANEKLADDVEEKAKNSVKKTRKKSGLRISKSDLESIASKKVLIAPLHRQAKRRLESQIVFQNIKKDLHQWNPIVHKNRVAEQIHFPLTEDPKEFTRRKNAAEKANEFEPRTELEQQTAKILGTSKYNLNNNTEYCEAEQEIIRSMSVKEARKRCEELQKMRALMSYKGAKMAQQAKIKSKQYHRIRKREQRRKLLKEIETLLVKDPASAAEKLKEFEKDRAFERATLKHRGTNRWSREMKQFAARNPQARQILDAHLRLGSELKSRSALAELDDDDEDSGTEKKTVEKKNLTVREIVERAADQADKESKFAKTSAQIISAKNPFLKSAVEAIQEERRHLLEQAKARANNPDKSGVSKSVNVQTVETSNGQDGVLVLDSRPLVTLPEELTSGVNEYDAEMQDNFLAEAYRDDDILAEDFAAEKKRVEETEQPKDVNMNLKGWGSWTGPGIKDRKRKNLIIPAKKLARRDANKSNVIIRETISKGVTDFQPRDIPFPFTSVRDYEAYIRQPLGRDWSSELAQQALVRPKIHTAAGRIIRPLEKSAKEILDDEDSD